MLQHAGVIIPTYNAAPHWLAMQAALEQQGLAPQQVLVIDSCSEDGTARWARKAGYRVAEVRRETFRHGATRQKAATLFEHKEFLIYLTQDAIPREPSCFEHLLSAFQDASVGAVYGRQVARNGAGAIEKHARLFNYPACSEKRNLASREQMGFRAAFFSNSFAAYRRSAFEQVGGFPSDTIVSEEVTVAARLLLSGWQIVYEADAVVTHSHDFNLRQEFARYFDIGVHHGRSGWLLQQFGTAGNQGRAFLRSQAQFLWKNDPLRLPEATGRNLAKWISYRLGVHEHWLPLRWKKRISGQQMFWNDEAQAAQKSAKLARTTLLS